MEMSSVTHNFGAGHLTGDEASVDVYPAFPFRSPKSVSRLVESLARDDLQSLVFVVVVYVEADHLGLVADDASYSPELCGDAVSEHGFEVAFGFQAIEGALKVRVPVGRIFDVEDRSVGEDAVLLGVAAGDGFAAVGFWAGLWHLWG
jgi:hypothetical protein